MKRVGTLGRRTSRVSGFTLVELIAAVALLVILMGILFVVFGEAGRTVSIGRTRMERYRTARAVFRLLEDDITSAFLIRDTGGTTHGFTGEEGSDPAFLNPAPDGDSDRLTLILPRRGFDPSDLKPGFVEVCYLRINGRVGTPVLAGWPRERPNALFRLRDEEAAGKPGTYEGQPAGWTVGTALPLGFPIPTQSDGGYSTYLNDHRDDFMNYLVALNVTDLQFDYMRVGQTDWEGSGDWDCNLNGLPAAVKVTIRVGPADSRNPEDHDTFTQVIYLPTAP